MEAGPGSAQPREPRSPRRRRPARGKSRSSTCRARRSRRELPTPWDELERARDEDLAPSEERPPWADEATIAAVGEFLGTLDDGLKRVHRVRYIEGLSQREAAERLGISRQNLRTLEAKLRDGLRARLERS